jgi:hypothetical protein
MGAPSLTSLPLLVAPTAVLIEVMSLWGPMIREVPVSTMAWQPPTQATAWPLTETLEGGGDGSDGSDGRQQRRARQAGGVTD